MKKRLCKVYYLPIRGRKTLAFRITEYSDGYMHIRKVQSRDKGETEVIIDTWDAKHVYPKDKKNNNQQGAGVKR